MRDMLLVAEVELVLGGHLRRGHKAFLFFQKYSAAELFCGDPSG